MAKKKLYFSRSWKPEHVDLNLAIWRLVADKCDLLMDEPSDNYFINRLEELIRRSDLFLAALPYRKPGARAAAPPDAPQVVMQEGDECLNCSPGSLFEIRLAERANRPRLVFYDYRTGFKPPDYPPPTARYIAANFDEIKVYLKNRRLGEQLEDDIRDWLDKSDRQLAPRNYRYSDVSLLLLPDDLPARDAVERQIVRALEAANYRRPVTLSSKSFRNDAELFRLLAMGGLLVAEVSDLTNFGLYSIAHARFVPAIRLFHGTGEDVKRGAAPWLLRGHPGGYQHDLVCWTEPDEAFFAAVRDRALAMTQHAETIDDYDLGCQMLESSRYAKHRVFISHDRKPGERALVDAIIAELKKAAISCWEYDEENRAGEDWRQKMEAEIEQATLFVVLFSNTFEMSGACMQELDAALRHPERVLPFRIEGRDKPHYRLSARHHQALGADAEAAAREVVAEVKKKLDEATRKG
jgi:hypothetical protein